MFMRWLPLLKSQSGIERVGLMIFAPLADFCDWSALGVDEVYRIGVDKIPFGQWQYATSIMSMPAVFDVRSWGDIPASHPAFIKTRPDTGSMMRLGFCWRAEENSSPVRIVEPVTGSAVIA